MMIVQTKPTINVVRLSGGLGNQMFQYIFGKSLEVLSGMRTQFDTQVYSRNYTRLAPETIREFGLGSLRTDLVESSPGIEKDYGLNFAIQSNKFSVIVDRLTVRILNKKRYVQEAQFSFNPDVYNNLTQGCYYMGYWQSQEYFRLDKTQISAEFKPKLPLNPAALDLQDKIINTRGICLNVRRGDFVSNKATFKFHGVLSKEYYLKALDILRAHHDSNYVYIFSDDLDWCLKNFQQDYFTFIVPHTFAGPNFVHYLELMKSCSAFVIPNSTFGWWGAYLSEVDGSKIIAPNNWFADPFVDTSDLIPSSWTRL